MLLSLNIVFCLIFGVLSSQIENTISGSINTKQVADLWILRVGSSDTFVEGDTDVNEFCRSYRIELGVNLVSHHARGPEFDPCHCLPLSKHYWGSPACCQASLGLRVENFGQVSLGLVSIA